MRYIMTNEADIKEIQEEIDELQKYPIKMTWKQLWIILTTLITIIGGSFGVGMKVDYEAQKIVQLKIERDFHNQLSVKEDDLIGVRRELKESKEDNIFYLNRYTIMKTRLAKCVDKLDEDYKDKAK